jgi:hypothetical protein
MTGSAGASSVRGMTWQIELARRRSSVSNQLFKSVSVFMSPRLYSAQARITSAARCRHDIVADLAQLGEIDPFLGEHFSRCLGTPRIAATAGSTGARSTPTVVPASTRGHVP